MKANLKDVFKGKSKYILILPLIFMLLFGLVMYMDKNSPAKASDSHSSVYMEYSRRYQGRSQQGCSL